MALLHERYRREGVVERASGDCGQQWDPYQTPH